MRVPHGVLLRVLPPLLMLGGATAHAAALDPPDIVAYTVSDSSVTLSWKRSAPLRGKTTYTVRYCVAAGGGACTPTLSGLVTRELEGSVTGLAPDTFHRFEVHARDRGGNEAIGGVDVNGTVEPGPLPLATCSPASTCDGSGYFLPPEGGLYGYEGASNLGDHIGRMDGDEALIDYVRIYTGP